MLLEKLEKEKLLYNLGKLFTEETGFVPVIATEIEFYISINTQDVGKAVLNEVYDRCKTAHIPVEKAASEVAEGQFEVSLKHTTDIIKLAQDTVKLKDIIHATAEKHGATANFSAKPFPELPGSGLHIHFSLQDKNGTPLFAKHVHALLSGDEEEENVIPDFNNQMEEGETPLMQYCIGGLLDTMLESVIFLAPQEDSYARFTAHFNDAPHLARYNNAPVNVSWSGNNRTTAIRIPPSTGNPAARHLEYRVAGADANPYIAIAVVLSGALHGIRHKTLPPEKIWGNAFDTQYDLPPLPASLDEAENLSRKGKIIRPLLKKYAK